VVLYPVKHVKSPNGDNWLAGFHWRKSHIINGSSYGALTDYAVRINVYRTTGVDNAENVYIGEYCRADFDDVRFTNATGLELDYFLYNQTGNVAKFWVEIDVIPAYPGNATIYLYFGNSTATTTSNAQAASLHGHGDDLNDQSMNVTLWELYKQSPVHGTALEDVNGFLNCRSTVGNAVGYVSVNRYVLSDLEISVYVNLQTENTNDLLVSSYHDNDYPNPQNAGNNYCISYKNSTDEYVVYRRVSNTKTVRFQQTWNRSTGDEYLRMRIYDGDIKFIEGEYERYSESWALPSTNMYFYIVSNVDNDEGPLSNLFDNFYIRKYVEPEPTHFAAWGYMETNAGWALNDYDYRKHLTLVSYAEELNNYQVQIVTHAGDESLSTNGVLGNNTPDDAHTYPVTCVAFGGVYTPNASGYINQVSLHVEQMGTDYPNITVAVYSNHLNVTNNQPMRLLAYGGVWTVTPGFDGWQTWDLNKTLDVGLNMEYWLIGWQINTTKKYEGAQYNFTDGPATIQTMDRSLYPNFPDPWIYSDVPDQIEEAEFMFIAELTNETKDNVENVYLNNHAQNDFDDVRFTWETASGTQTPLRYWIQDTDLHIGDNATFWVEVPTIYNTSVSYLYLYYGNATVGNQSTSDIFDFFEHFDNGSLPAGWAEYKQNPAVASPTFTNSTIIVASNTSSWYLIVYNNQNFSDGYAFRMYSRRIGTNWWSFGGQGPFDPTQATQAIYRNDAYRVYDLEATFQLWQDNESGGTKIDTTITKDTSYHIVESARYNSSEAGNDGAYIEFNTTRKFTSRFTNVDRVWVLSTRGSAGSYLEVDWCLVRKFVEHGKQPTYAWGPEGWHSVTVTYYFSSGGVFWVNQTAVLNSSSFSIYWTSSINLAALGNTSVIFNNFTITNLVNLTTGLNPYLYNFTSDAETVVWCRFRAEEITIRYDMFFGGLIIVGCIGGLLGYATRRRN